MTNFAIQSMRYIKTATMTAALLCAAICQGCTSCSDTDNRLSDDDYERVDSYAGEYARRIVSVSDSRMDLEGILLDVHARSCRLADEYGQEAADRFKASRADTFRTISPEVYHMVSAASHTGD